MKGAWRAADIRAAEKTLMAKLPEGTLMQRAAAGLARRCAGLLQDRYGGVYGRTVLVLAGSGDNGGDAMYAGAALARRGADVRVIRLSDRIHGASYRALEAAGGRPLPGPPARIDLVIDGIVGIGGRGALRERAAEVVGEAAAATASDGGSPVVVAVDVPSGVDVDTGDVPDASAAVRADVTVTFGALKPAHVVGAAAVHSGLVDLVDIGLAEHLVTKPAVQVPDRTDIAGWWPSHGSTDDKYTRGVVGLATGSDNYPGAAVLSVAGALAGPTGYVRYAGTAAREIRERFPSVVCTDSVGSAGRAQAWVCGSGLGTDERAAAELRAVLAKPVPVILDADALTLLADGSMARPLREREAATVITPHDREFARIAGAEPGGDRVESALQLAAQMNAVVLLKGDRTIVAAPDGTAFANPTGSVALATAGTGDVLAGLLGSLLAAGLPAPHAALAAAYVHGLAGRVAAGSGPVVSPDVADALREAVVLATR
ncbi:NAD(P)H-hydrate dehydratase [Virgisporangium aurantiacum]|uniref:Bifunctional NAD(P)H-hydrate repair enzyme n=1 Tax=Virgisporangium aurantiacum TaxID=175570 RepID=A0A8J3Z983_9ACTN|nr:NAD(P)H-hydrate dehydratase [Virgisporangium aurantiacum]GIJ58717.1 bifunctional NAD(P)H-hydrate repair enzyme [Virgisporangium aurantiacum]